MKDLIIVLLLALFSGMTFGIDTLSKAEGTNENTEKLTDYINVLNLRGQSYISCLPYYRPETTNAIESQMFIKGIAPEPWLFIDKINKKLPYEPDNLVFKFNTVKDYHLSRTVISNQLIITFIKKSK